MTRNVLVIIGAIVTIAVFGSGYYVGANTGSRPAAATQTTTGNVAGTVGAAGRGGAGAGGAAGATVPLSGRILSVNADSITIVVTQRAGGPGASASPATSSSIALVGTTTRLVKTTETDVKLTDLRAGDQVTVIGVTDASTGTISAQTVVVGTLGIGGLFGGGPGGPGGGGAPRPAASPGR